ncbi:MAG: thioesterase [Proteobacteria bacterium]|nr:MAG: thioesterase [Pseudomonadota bacterium]
MADEREYGPNAWGAAVGIELLEVGAERVRARVDVGARHHQPYGIAHGGVYSSIVEDVASVGAGMAALARGQRGVVGVSNATDFLRSHAKGGLDAVGTPLHVGRTQQLWQVEIRRESDAKLVARGQVRFAVLDALPAERRARESG